jgi:UDP-N-acetyl-D-glucosamine dehydrogenase
MFNRVGIIGLGYVGLPLVLAFCRAGCTVTGFDIDQDKVDQLSRGESYIDYIPPEEIKALLGAGSFSSTTDFSRLREVEAIIIAVPTPLSDYREPDLQYIEKTAETIAQYLQKGQLVVLESTTYPGPPRKSCCRS